MNKLKRILVVLLSCFMFLTTLTASVTAEGEEGAELEPVIETEPEVEEEGSEEQTEEAASEEEIPAEEVLAEEPVIEETDEMTEEVVSEATDDEYTGEELTLETLQIESLSQNNNGYTVNAESESIDSESLKPLGTSKTLTYNEDGTYTLALSVTGDSQSSSETTTTSVNVVIVYDASNSMSNYAASKYGSRTTNGRQLYKRSGSSYVAISDAENYDGTVYYQSGWGGYQVYTDDRCMNARRRDATEYAIYNMVNSLQDGKIEFAFVYFSDSSNTGYRTFGGNTNYWTMNPNSDFSSFLSTTGELNSAKLDEYHSGTNWQAGLGKALDPVLASADSEDTYVLFITDGAPNNGFSSNNQYRSYEAALDNARSIETYKTSSHESVTDSTDNTTMFAIYAYGTESDYLDDLMYYALNGTERTAGTGTNEDGLTGRYFNAGSTEALNDAIKSITNTIKNSANYGGVDYADGIATDTTSTTLSTSIDSGEVTGLTYTVSQGGETKYTVTTDGTNVVFTVGGVEYNGVKGSFKMNETDDNSYEYYYAVDSNGDPLTFTVGSGDTAQTYQYKMGLADYTNGNLDWDLTGIGGLVGGYTYTLSFTVWPVQGAYDAAADLNNGLATWDTTLATYEDKTSTLGYEIGGCEGYPNIVKYPNGTYAVLTNTTQSVEYYVVETEEIDGVPTTTYDGPYTTTPTSPSPMGLVGSSIDLIKEWLVSLSPQELQDWVDKGNTLTLRVTIDDDQYVDYTFPVEEGMETITDEHGNVDWKRTVNIAPGILLNKTKAIAEGIDTTKYSTVTIDGTEYCVLGDGHEYTVEEISGSDLHFEFSTQTYHPMLVDGVMKNVSFEIENGKIKDGSTATVTDANLTEFKGTNKLKGGISIYKEVYKADMTTKIDDCTDEFAFKVTLWAEDAAGAKTPVYTTDDQFENGTPKSGSFGYRVYEDNEDGSSTTVQRDAIYSGTTPASVTVGTETTEMIVTMQANQYCYIVNVPAGTKYTVEELQSENAAYNHFYSSVSVLEGDDTTGTYEVIEEKKLSGDATALTDHLVDGYVSANSSSKAIFKNWAGSFYVYHSSDNTIEKISFADERVKATYTADGYNFAFNIAEETKANNLYGGYYKSYDGAKLTDAEIIGSDQYTVDSNAVKYTYAADRSNGLWISDTEATKYDGSKAEQWDKTKYYDETGLAINAKADTVYYLKEVPSNKYLQPYTHYTYYKYSPYKLGSMWMISDIDDNNYSETGFIIIDDQNNIAKVCKSLTVKTTVGGTSVKLTPEKVFKAKGVTSNNLLTYYDETELLKGDDPTITMYWKTLDGIYVTSAVSRTLTIGNATKSTFKKTDKNIASTINSEIVILSTEGED